MIPVTSAPPPEGSSPLNADLLGRSIDNPTVDPTPEQRIKQLKTELRETKRQHVKQLYPSRSGMRIEQVKFER